MERRTLGGAMDNGIITLMEDYLYSQHDRNILTLTMAKGATAGQSLSIVMSRAEMIGLLELLTKYLGIVGDRRPAGAT